MHDLNALQLPDLFAALTEGGGLDRLLKTARNEDFGDGIGDITTASIIDPAQQAQAIIAARSAGIIAGMAVLPHLFQDTSVKVKCVAHDGRSVTTETALAELSGPLHQMLCNERIALNIIGRLSGIATLTRQYVDAIAETVAVICDTRKTTPGLRNLEKYAVRCGGGTLHRVGLFDAALYKDNHLAGIPLEQLRDRLSAAIRAARAQHEVRFVEVEVDTPQQLDAILSMDSGLVDIVLLDNMSDGLLHEAVMKRNARSPHLLLEASGGVTLERVRSIAETGVDRISVGALTHAAMSLDVGLDML